MSNPTAETMSTEHLDPAQYPFCPHGVRLGGSTLPVGMWNGPVSQCRCCFTTFGYIDMGSLGPDGAHGRSWNPKDRCGSCGGEYHDY